jgi:hypothetical protein
MNKFLADKQMNLAASTMATINHTFMPPVKPGFVGVFYWQILI